MESNIKRVANGIKHIMIVEENKMRDKKRHRSTEKIWLN